MEKRVKGAVDRRKSRAKRRTLMRGGRGVERVCGKWQTVAESRTKGFDSRGGKVKPSVPR